MPWNRTLGSWHMSEGTQFRVWAPVINTLEVILDGAPTAPRLLAKSPDGFFTGVLADVGPGQRYRYRVDGQGPFPDPASRFQPDGVHGPSEVIDPHAFAWTDASWQGIAMKDAIIYELHVGTFTPAGTFAGVMQRLPDLVKLGVTAIELMPVADFPGQRNWGYDGVNLFAPARCYGRPDDLRRLVDAAHSLGLAVFLDVVYNHFGPDGNYMGFYSPCYFSKTHQSPWGAGLNFDGENSLPVRDYFIENALHWIHEYHIDGLRLDATHAIVDNSPRHFLAEFSTRVRAGCAGRNVLLIAEDHRNLAYMMKPVRDGGFGLDGVWADDFHHHVRRHLAGDHEGYYSDFTGSSEDLAATVRQGWFFTGQHSAHLDEPRGSDGSELPAEAFVICVQNHDQIGNRAMGDRLHHQVDLAAYRAATVLLLCAPQTPMLFMGQEWATSAPFQFFTDHNEELGKLVTEGRRKEFRHFSAFSDPAARERIPDPQAESTFLRSRLDWGERERDPHAGTLRLVQALVGLRRSEPALRAAGRDDYAIEAMPNGLLLLKRTAASEPTLLIVINLDSKAEVDLQGHAFLKGLSWDILLNTEDPAFTSKPSQPRIELSDSAAWIAFQSPGAVILKER